MNRPAFARNRETRLKRCRHCFWPSAGARLQLGYKFARTTNWASGVLLGLFQQLVRIRTQYPDDGDEFRLIKPPLTALIFSDK